MARSLLVFETKPGSGLIDVEKFRHAMCSLGDVMTKQEVRACVVCFLAEDELQPVMCIFTYRAWFNEICVFFCMQMKIILKDAGYEGETTIDHRTLLRLIQTTHM